MVTRKLLHHGKVMIQEEESPVYPGGNVCRITTLTGVMVPASIQLADKNKAGCNSIQTLQTGWNQAGI